MSLSGFIAFTIFAASIGANLFSTGFFPSFTQATCPAPPVPSIPLDLWVFILAPSALLVLFFVLAVLLRIARRVLATQAASRLDDDDTETEDEAETDTDDDGDTDFVNVPVTDFIPAATVPALPEHDTNPSALRGIIDLQNRWRNMTIMETIPEETLATDDAGFIQTSFVGIMDLQNRQRNTTVMRPTPKYPLHRDEQYARVMARRTLRHIVLDNIPSFDKSKLRRVNFNEETRSPYWTQMCHSFEFQRALREITSFNVRTLKRVQAQQDDDTPPTHAPTTDITEALPPTYAPTEDNAETNVVVVNIFLPDPVALSEQKAQQMKWRAERLDDMERRTYPVDDDFHIRYKGRVLPQLESRLRRLNERQDGPVIDDETPTRQESLGENSNAGVFTAIVRRRAAISGDSDDEDDGPGLEGLAGAIYVALLQRAAAIFGDSDDED